MALTRNGRRTGRAGAQELAELRAMLADEAEAELKKKRDGMRAQYAYWLEWLQILDPKGWSAWYDEHVPDWLGWTNSQPAIDMMEARMAELLGVAVPFHGLSEADVALFCELVEQENDHALVVAQSGGA